MDIYSIALFSAMTLMRNSINAQLTEMDCYENVNWVNDYDGEQQTIPTDHFFSGVYSVHDSHHEDRRFRFRYCKPSTTSIGPFTGGMSVTLPVTGYDEEWERSCRNYNGGHAAIHGISSVHDSHAEDRQFTIYCGLLDLSKHRLDLESCYTPSFLFFGRPIFSYQNEYDGILDYDCPNNGVIRTIASVHDNHAEDRRFQFECCNLVDITYEFSDIVGEWEPKQSCLGCPDHEYMREFGTESTISQSIESTYSNELSTTVSAGFEFEFGLSSSISVTGTASESISRSMQSAFTTSYTESTTLPCPMTYLYAWVIRGEEERSDGSSGTFFSYSNDYLCTNNASPQCPLGYCTDSDCETCTDDF